MTDIAELFKGLELDPEDQAKADLRWSKTLEKALEEQRRWQRLFEPSPFEKRMREEMERQRRWTEQYDHWFRPDPLAQRMMDDMNRHRELIDRMLRPDPAVQRMMDDMQRHRELMEPYNNFDRMRDILHGDLASVRREVDLLRPDLGPVGFGHDDVEPTIPVHRLPVVPLMHENMREAIQEAVHDAVQDEFDARLGPAPDPDEIIDEEPLYGRDGVERQAGFLSNLQPKDKK